MRSICRSPTDRAAKGIRPCRRRDRGRRALACRSETSSPRREARAVLRNAIRSPLTSLLGSLRPQLEPDFLVDELQRVGLAIIKRRRGDSGPYHLLEKLLHARIGHGADSGRACIAG